jgi:hypothetical protein
MDSAWKRSWLREFFREEDLFVRARGWATWVLDFAARVLMIAVFSYLARKSGNWLLIGFSWIVSGALSLYLTSYFLQLLAWSSAIWAYGSRTKRIVVVAIAYILIDVLLQIVSTPIEKVAEAQGLK